MTQYIFDTNYYRNFVHGKSFTDFQNEIDQQKIIENQKGFKILFPIVSAIELINHLNENNASATECFKALNLLVRHCDDSNKKGCTVPTFYDLLTMYFFRKKSKNFIYNNNILSISHEISNSNELKILKKFKSEIEQIISIKKQEKENIIRNIENLYLKSFNSGGNIDWDIFDKNQDLKKEFKDLIKSKDMHKLIGLSFVNLAMEQTDSKKIKLSKEEFENNFVKNDFKTGIDFYVKEIIQKMVDLQNKEYFYKPETDPKKRWNSFYDTQLILATEYENYFGRKTILVTLENKIRESFKTNGKEDLVISPEEYNNLIK